MPPPSNATLKQMQRAAQLISEFIRSVDEESFKTDLLRQSAVQHQLLIIGEAITRLSIEVRDAHPQIPWATIKRMRDRLIHRYDTVDIDVVWRMATVSIPELDVLLEQLLVADDESRSASS